MKKFLVVMVVLAFVGMGTMAFAADVSVGGSLQIRSRDFNQLDFDKDLHDNQIDTQSRIIMNINVKAGDDVKGKISLWNDFSDWGSNFNGFSTDQNFGNGFGQSTAGLKADTFGFREAWVSFNIPGIPINVTAGHQLLQLANGWFARSMHFGSDAWVVANVTGGNTIAILDATAQKGLVNATHDDIDAYIILDQYAIDDKNTVGLNVTDAHLTNANDLYNIGILYNGQASIVKWKLQADFQTGQNKTNTTGGPQPKYKGDEVVLQGNVLLDPVTINILLGYGTGAKQGQTDVNQMITFLDIDPHYTFLYEYKITTAAGATHTGMNNTTVESVGAMWHALKSLDLGADVYFLQASEKTNVALTGGGAGALATNLGTEVDLHINWKLYDNLSWNWDLGWFDPGAVYKDAAGKGTDSALGIQGILAFNF
ncbi:MAG TPA: alginate export family protein [Nitrospirota bacterium]|nr:alginate export family protein [Nitrospirota bacterium]